MSRLNGRRIGISKTRQGNCNRGPKQDHHYEAQVDLGRAQECSPSNQVKSGSCSRLETKTEPAGKEAESDLCGSHTKF
jgi:hypothetical protein